MTSVFVSYRRDDSHHAAGRLYDRLVAQFGQEQVFKDVDSIPLGLDFREVLTERVAGCDVFLAVIGDTWLSIAGKDGMRRLDDLGDFVRIEIEAALSREIPVIPVLVGHCPVPRADELPECLRKLAFRNGLPVRPDPDFHKDVDRLIRGINDVVAALQEPDAPPPPLPSRHRPRWPLRVAAAVLGLFLLGVIIYVETDKGRIRIVVNDPKAVVKIDGGEAIRIEALGDPITLRAGEHALDVTWGDGKFQTRTFIIRRGDDERLRVEYEPTRKSEATTKPSEIGAAVQPGMGRDSAAPPKPAAKVIAKEMEAAAPSPTIAGPGTERDSAAPPKPIAKPVGPTVPPGQMTNSIGVKLVLIPAGEFMMGSDATDPGAYDDEFLDKAAGKKEKHRVRITRPFYLGATEVTRGQFRRFVDEAGYRTEAERDGKGGSGWNEDKKTWEQDPKYTWLNPGFEQTDEHPVVNVSWNDAVAFCEWLTRKEGVAYRLPTEAEWEYACRAGTTTKYSSGDDPEGLAAAGNIADGTAKAMYPVWTTIAARDGSVFTAPVGRYNPNAWGLFDMHGNVWEWCSDGYAADYYKRSPVDDPQGADGASDRVFRGGGWYLGPRSARSAARLRLAPGVRSSGLGFRLARVQSVR